MSISENIQKIKANLPANLKLVCVSKFQPDAAILDAYRAGCRDFGESRVQELCAKHERLPRDIRWHFIGHLQKNKVKFIANFVELIHSADSILLLQKIENQAVKANRQINCLLQIHIAQEETKFGFLPAELLDLLQNNAFAEFKNLKICGLMGMATFTDSEAQIRSEFQNIAELFKVCKQKFFADNAEFTELSLGMSHDYRLAIETGSTMLRIGSSIFGERT